MDDDEDGHARAGRAERGGRRLDFNYFIRALIDVPRTAAISAGPLAATFYTRSPSFVGVSYVRQRGREGGIVGGGFCEEPCRPCVFSSSS